MRRLDPASLGDHVDSLYRAAWALCGSREDAEDLVQETLARVLTRPRLVRGDARGYLLQALRNTYFTQRRTASRRPQTVAMPEGLQPVDARGPAPDRAAEASEILAAIGELPEDFRLAIVAVDIVGLSYVEAARTLGVPEATLTTRLHRARQRIGARFADRPPPEAVSSPRAPGAAGVDNVGGREGTRPHRSP